MIDIDKLTAPLEHPPELFREPYIQIGDHVLTEAQASSVRCAVAHLHNEIATDSEFKAELGPIGDAYYSRLNEVLAVIAATGPTKITGLKYDKERRTIVNPDDPNDPVNWGRPHLEKQYRMLRIAAKKAEAALGHACNPPGDEDSRASDMEMFGVALDELRRCLEGSAP